jgi:hypothetical protein
VFGCRQNDDDGMLDGIPTWSVTTSWRRGRRRPGHGSAPYTRAVFFVFGLGTKQQHLGPGETRTCPRCHNTTQQTRMREFRQFTVFFVPVARWKRRLFEACSICGTAVEV